MFQGYAGWGLSLVALKTTPISYFGEQAILPSPQDSWGQPPEEASYDPHNRLLQYFATQDSQGYLSIH